MLVAEFSRILFPVRTSEFFHGVAVSGELCLRNLLFVEQVQSQQLQGSDFF